MCAHLLSCLASILGLNSGEPELEVEAESEVELEGAPVQSPATDEYQLTEAPVVLAPMVLVDVQVVLIAVHLLLRVNVL